MKKKGTIFGQEQVVKIILIIIVLVIVLFMIGAMTGQSIGFFKVFGRLGR